jgi:hypothetical protein
VLFLNLDLVSVSELTTKRLTFTLNDIIHYFYVEKVKKILPRFMNADCLWNKFFSFFKYSILILTLL